jgi:aldose 1-epimerase
MPAGMGWHPYYNRVLSRAGEVVHLCMKVKAAYPDANGNRIPSGPAESLTPAQDFSTEKPLAPDYFLDTCFQGYDGQGYIVWPLSGIRVSFQCSPECTHLVIFNPLNKPYFAVEPVTNATNGVNLYSQGELQSGIVSLPPGKSFEARFEQRVDILS